MSIKRKIWFWFWNQITIRNTNRQIRQIRIKTEKLRLENNARERKRDVLKNEIMEMKKIGPKEKLLKDKELKKKFIDKMKQQYDFDKESFEKRLKDAAEFGAGPGEMRDLIETALVEDFIETELRESTTKNSNK